MTPPCPWTRKRAALPADGAAGHALWHWDAGVISGNVVTPLYRLAFGKAQIPCLDRRKFVEIHFLSFKARCPGPDGDIGNAVIPDQIIGL